MTKDNDRATATLTGHDIHTFTLFISFGHIKFAIKCNTRGGKIKLYKNLQILEEN